MAEAKKKAASFEGFSDDERAAMKDHATELKKSARRGKDKAAEAEAAAQDVVDKIAEMPGPDRELGEKIHAIVTKNAPGLAPRLWYGQPAYAKDGKVLCFFQPASKFKTRYATLGFSDEANLDDGAMWPSAFALTKLTAADEKRIAELVKRAAS